LAQIDVDCQPDDNGWICEVQVTDDRSTTHTVEIPQSDYNSLIGSTGADVSTLVEESFEFLLEREPQGAIMSRFDIMTIESYFPEYTDTITSRLK